MTDAWDTCETILKAVNEVRLSSISFDQDLELDCLFALLDQREHCNPEAVPVEPLHSHVIEYSLNLPRNLSVQLAVLTKTILDFLD